MANGQWTAPAGAWRTVWVLTFVYVMAIVDRMVLLLLIPGIKASMGLTDTQVSLLHGLAFAICFSIAGLFLGYLADRRNRRNLLMAGVLGWGLATMACGLAQNFTQFFIARMAVGGCQAVMAPAAISMLADLFPTEHRGRPTALLMSAAMFGGALVNFAVGGLLAYYMSHPAPVLPVIGQTEPWQMALFGVGAPTLLAIPLLTMVSEPTRETTGTTAEQKAAGGSLADHITRNAGMFILLFSFFYHPRRRQQRCGQLVACGIHAQRRADPGANRHAAGGQFADHRAGRRPDRRVAG